MRSLRTLPTIFNCFKYSTYVVVKPDGVSWSAYRLNCESNDNLSKIWYDIDKEMIFKTMV